jgi:hypothetical protein
MAADELMLRVRRIYAAIDAAQEFDMSKLPGKVISHERVIRIFQDFSSGLSDADLANLAHTIIHNIANLKDHLLRWAVRNSKDKSKVDATFDGSPALKIIQDLSNVDKHGAARPGSSKSGHEPKLDHIRRVLKLTTQARAGSGVVMVLGPDGRPEVSGDGSACAIVTGNVVDKDGKLLGDLFAIEQQALGAWEGLLADFGVNVPKESSA